MSRTHAWGLGLTLALAAGPALAEEAPAKVGYDKGFFIEQGAFRLKIGGRVQARGIVLAEDPGEADQRYQSMLQARRVRLKLSGFAHTKRLKYVVQLHADKSAPGLKDAYLNWTLAPKSLYLRMGQFKRTWSRQQLNSTSALNLIDRAITDGAFGGGRGVGFTLGNRPDVSKEGTLAWEFGVFGDTGTSHQTEDSPVVAVARLGYNHGDVKGYKEADLAGGGLRFGVALGAHHVLNLDQPGSPTEAEKAAGVERTAETMVNVDGVLKVAHFSLTGAFYQDLTEDAEKIGAHAEVGYVLGGKYQPSLRYAMVKPDADDSATTELTGGLAIYLAGHALKVNLDATLLSTEKAASVTGEETTDMQGRAQLQMVF